MRTSYSRRVLTLAAGLLLASTAFAQTNLIQNGSFELGSLGGAYANVAAPNTTTINSWLVTGSSVDYIGSYWQASDGVRSVDLAGLGLGGVQQSFGTTIGSTYSVSFDIAGNPDGAPTVKTAAVQVLNASANQDFFQSYTFNTTGHVKTSMGWLTNTFSFLASSNTALLWFSAGGTSTNFGPAIDNVRVTAIPEPSTIGLLTGSVLFAAVCIIRRRKA